MSYEKAIKLPVPQDDDDHPRLPLEPQHRGQRREPRCGTLFAPVDAPHGLAHGQRPHSETRYYEKGGGDMTKKQFEEIQSLEIKARRLEGFANFNSGIYGTPPTLEIQSYSGVGLGLLSRLTDEPEVISAAQKAAKELAQKYRAKIKAIEETDENPSLNKRGFWQRLISILCGKEAAI